MKQGESMRSRGYTLIEIAGVMVVLGLLLGASLLPLDRQLRESEYRQERANMERLRDAVLGYALRHRTPGVEVIIFDEDAGTQQTGLYAKGRPYLPCPDRIGDGDGDGDGIADRYDLVNPVMQALSLSFARPTPRNDIDSSQGFSGVNFQPSSRVPPILYNSVCHVNKGQLPWRTLGSIPADYWGNRYTYFADTAFATEATGFDEKTIADSGERRMPRVIDLTLGYIPQRREPLDTVDGNRTDGRPSIICPAAVVDADAAPENFMCGQDGTITAPATVVAGEPAPAPVVAGEPAPLDGNPFVSPSKDIHGFPDIADGLPFVIVSHGHNGFGAANHLLLRQDILVCRSFADPNAHGHERANANQYVVYAIGLVDSSPSCDAFDFRGQSFSGNRRGYFFAHRSDVSAARAASSLSDQTGLDDLLVWMTRGDLARRMSEAGVFPLILKDSDRPPVFYEPP